MNAPATLGANVAREPSWSSDPQASWDGADDSPEGLRRQLRRRTPPTGPFISVLMTAYNAMPYLPEAIESILSQTHREFQLVVVDDGSTDATADYLDSLDDSRLSVIHQVNAGTAAAANRGLMHCHGRWVARMDADDIAEPDRLQRQLEFLSQNPDVVLVGSRFRYFGAASIGRPMRLPLEHDGIVENLRLGHHAIAHGTVMCRTEALLSIGGYWTHRFFEDWDFFLRISQRGRLANLPEPLYRYRAVAGSLSSSRTAAMHLHYRYAIDADRCRRAGRPEPRWATFAAPDQSGGWVNRFVRRLDDVAMVHYRRSLADRFAGRRWRSGWHLSIAAVINPARTTRRLTRRLRD